MIRIVLRLSIRLIARRKRHAALVCCAIALPVLVGTAIAATSATAAISVAEARQVAFGDADGRVSVTDDTGDPGDTSIDTARLLAVLPADSRAVPDLDLVRMPITTVGTGRRVDATGRALALTDPLARDVYLLRAGSADADADTIVLSTALAERLGVGVGDPVTIGAGQSATVTVSGLVDSRFDTTQQLFVLPDTRYAWAAEIVGTPRWFVDLPAGTAVDPQPLAAAGFGWTPATEAAELATQDAGDQQPAVLIGLGLLAETVLLISAVFAVVVRGQRRDLGLLAALGAGQAVRAGVFPLYALCVAGLGIGVGVGAGEALARSAIPVLQRRADADWGPFDPAPGTIAVLAAAAACAAVVAIVIPTRHAARLEITDLLRDVTPLGVRAGARMRRSAVAALGIGVFGVGAAAVAGTDNAGWLAGSGFVAGIVGTCLGVVAVAGRLGATAILPLHPVPRAAARSVLGYPARTVLTLMALAAVAAVASLALLVTASATARNTAAYQPALPTGMALVTPRRSLTDAELAALADAATDPTSTDPTSADPTSAGSPRIARPAMFLVAATVVDGHTLPVSPRTDFLRCLDERGLLRYGTNDWRACAAASSAESSSMPFAAVGIADVDDAQTLTGRRWTQAERVAYERGERAAGTGGGGLGDDVTLVYQDRTATGISLVEAARLPLIAAARGSTGFTAVPMVLVSRAAAGEIHLLPAGSPHYLLDSADPDGIRLALPVDVQADAEIAVETGPPGRDAARRLLAIIVAVAVVSGTVVVATMMALWVADLRREFAMLGAIGAGRRWRRAATAIMAGATAALGTVIGALWGLAAGLAFLTAVDTTPAMPIWMLALLSIGPAAAAGVGAAVAPRHALPARRA